ncbi:MAG: phage tail protein [Candidatus Binataceae bacterium]
MAELTAAPSINDVRTQALLVLIERLSAFDLTPLLIYRIDSVVDGALVFLAWQFDILSPLWQLVAPVALSIDTLTDIDSLTDIDTLSGPESIAGEASPNAATERGLLKLAIALHRERGTPATIKRALSSLGWTDVAIQEGEASWGGTAFPSSEGWAVFRVLITLGPGVEVPAGAAQSAIAAVNFFQPARAWLDSLWFVAAPVQDSAPAPADSVTLGGIAEYQIDAAPPPSDAQLLIAITAAPYTDGYGPIAPIYNAHYAHSGITYGVNEPIVADPALIVNNVATLNGG